ncbi:MAG: rhodanese-like domain-containing protein, partial [Aeoliella sp.]
MSRSTITPAELRELLNCDDKPSLVDVRTPVEFREVHVVGSVNVPLDQLMPEKLPARTDGEPLYVICHKGSRGAQACQKLTAAGLENVSNVEGGTSACEAEGLPVTRGKKAMSLERQVRITAGSLVVLGIGLSFVHPAFL